jgi:transcriptional regulator with XRE-family HTH domain
MEMSTCINPSPTRYDTWAGCRSPALAAVVAVALNVGTGGVSNAAYYHERARMSYGLSSESALPQIAIVQEATTVENLDKIKNVLKPSMAELARALGVSRQALYDWQAGLSIASENAKKLKDLAGAADVFISHGLTANNQLLRREIGGRSFFDRIKNGESAEESARHLIEIVRRENEQREKLGRRLKDRDSVTTSEVDIGLPHLSEMD